MALLRFSIPSRVLKVPVEIRVSLPDSGSGFRTLWVLHGANCDCNEWFDDSNAVQVTRDHGFALVSVSIFNGFGVPASCCTVGFSGSCSGSNGVPQFVQNFAPSSCFVPQFGQYLGM